MRRSPAHRRGVYLISAGVVAAVLAAFLAAPRFVSTLEDKVYDLHFVLQGTRPPGGRVAIVAVDEKSLAAVGRWPWRRSVLARLITKLSEAGAKVIAVDVLLSEPEVTGELRVAGQLAQRFDALGLPGAGPAARTFREELATLARRSDEDAELEAAVRASGRVILPIAFQSDAPPAPAEAAPLLRSAALTSFRHYDERALYEPPTAAGVLVPVARLAAAARALGHVTMLADPDGSTRWEAVVFRYQDAYYPSLAIQAVRLALGVEPQAVRLDFGRALDIGPIAAPVGPDNRLLIRYAGPGGTVPHFPAVDVLDGRVPDTALGGRIVFIGTTAQGTFDLRVTPTSPVFPGVEKHATVAANLLAGDFLRRPSWVVLVDLAGIVFWPVLLAALLPRLRPAPSLAAAGLLWAGFLAATHVAFLEGLWLPAVYPSLALFLGVLAVMGYLYFTEERQRLGIKRAFQRFVSPELVERIAEDPAALAFGGEVRTLTVLFSDVRDFTTYTERHPPQELVQVLREYFTRMVERILACQGTLDKFIGDAIMALFGAPLVLPNHAEQACRAALAMVTELRALQAEWVAAGREPFRIGIGIATGDVVVGNLGSEQVFNYTAVGDTVNVASRLEGLTKEHATTLPIIISESTYQAARDVVDAREVGEVTVKGKTRPIVVYELLGLRSA